MATERYLVTGGCGLQGSHIVEKLLARYPIAPVVAVMARKPTTNLFSGVSYRAGDISSASDIARVFDAVRPTVVFHCAAAMTIGRGATAAGVPTDDDVRRINVGGTRLLLDASRERGVKAFVFTSSAGVVQRFGFKDIVNADESLETVRESDGAAIYPKTKAEAERLVLSANTPAGQKGLKTCALRPAAIYGERDNDVLPGILRALAAGRTRFQAGPNKALFATTYAGNSADAHLAAAEKLVAEHDAAAAAGPGPAQVDPSMQVAGEAFFVTNGVDMPFFTFCREVWRAAGDTTRPEDVKVVPFWLAVAFAWVVEKIAKLRGVSPTVTVDSLRFTNMTRYYNTEKARKRLGWEPAVAWDEGVRRGVQWFLDQQKQQEAKKAAAEAPQETAVPAQAQTAAPAA